MAIKDRLYTQETPRQILEEDYAALRSGFPIRGGWGYTLEDACIIDKNDPVVDKEMPFDGVGIEYVFVEKRIYEELIVFMPRGGGYEMISWNLLKQRLLSVDGRNYDHLTFDVTAFHEKTGEKIQLQREFWFDITSFY